MNINNRIDYSKRKEIYQELRKIGMDYNISPEDIIEIMKEMNPICRSGGKEK